MPLNPVAILKRAYDAIMSKPVSDIEMDAVISLEHAIQHVARPERSVYPKTRRGTKTRPVMRQNLRRTD